MIWVPTILYGYAWCTFIEWDMTECTANNVILHVIEISL